MIKWGRIASCRPILSASCYGLLLSYTWTVLAAPPILTLDEALAVAMKGNRQIQSSELDIQKATQVTSETRTLRFPQFHSYILGGTTLTPINFTIPAGTLGVYPGLGPLPSRDSEIKTPRRFTGVLYGTAAQPLSQLYKIGLGIRESKLGEDFARENHRSQKQEVALKVKETYYQMVRIQSQIAGAEATVKHLTELAALTDRRLAEEAVLRSDSLTVKAKLTLQKFDVFKLQDALQTEKEAINRLLGRDLATDFSVDPQPAPAAEEVDLNAAHRKALDQRSELRKARLQITKTELDIRRQRAEYLPEVSVQLSYLSLANINLLPQNVAQVGFLVQWQPFDWGQKRYRLEQQRTTAKQAVLTRDDAEQQVLLDVNAKYRKLIESRAWLDTQVVVQELEREKLRVVMNRFEEKAVLVADVLQQQSALAQADGQHEEALANFWLAKAAFDRALGEE